MQQQLEQLLAKNTADKFIFHHIYDIWSESTAQPVTPPNIR